MHPVESVLLENIDKPGSLFIFPTDVAASRWADHLLRLRGGGSVAMNKFIAWDTFKRDSVRSRVQDKRSIPQPLRKIFTGSLIRENAELCARGETPLFTSLIRVEWARQAVSFAGWLAELLPQLGVWFNKTTGRPAAFITDNNNAKQMNYFDRDDRDLYTLAMRYANFLAANGLFEPAWEKPPFDDTGKECFIFFPDCLNDYSEYRELLEASEHVKTVYAGESGVPDTKNDFFFYTNSRGEISEAALYIRSLHEREHISWDSISVSIPDSESYEPYVLREFTNRNIPFVKKTGKPLASYTAGQFFSAAVSCTSRDFAFDALRNLLLNSLLPWKNTAEIQKLMEFGINNNCISSWVEYEGETERPVNVWEDAFEQPYRGLDYSVSAFFRELKRHLNALRKSVSFADVQKNYFIFRERFLDMENCLPETDLVLSRCISELTYLTKIEKDFPAIPVPDPFMFFVEYLDDVNYLAQQKESGVAILPYRTAAPAPFDCHIVIGASQTGLSVVFSKMDFLPRSKREKLGVTEEDASSAFISLHKANSFKRAAFFCAENSLSGYAIPHNRLGAAAKPRPRYGEDTEYREKFSADLFRAESVFFDSLNSLPLDETGAAGGDSGQPAAVLHIIQSEGFNAWRLRRNQETELREEWKPDDSVLALIRRRFCGENFSGKYSVSASSLALYYQCSLKWLFERVLNLENIRLEADLMPDTVAGQVYHAALNLFFTALKDSGGTLAPPVFARNVPELPAAYRKLLAEGVDAVFDAFPNLPGSDGRVMSSLTARLLGAEKNQFRRRLERFLAEFLAYFAGSGVCGSEIQYQAERDTWFLNGTIDCLLSAPAESGSGTEPGAVIVDFKTNSMPKPADCGGSGSRGLSNFQLPAYLNLAEEKGQRQIDTALFFSIFKAEPQVLFGSIENRGDGTRIPRKDDNLILRNSETFNNIMNEFTRKARRFAKEIENGEFSVFESSFDECGKCRYHRICRTVYKIDQSQSFASRSIADGK